jgi:patatin-related protein
VPFRIDAATASRHTDFDLANASVGLCRTATSSLPGAFPPARILEIDQLIQQRSIDWPHRAKFISGNFDQYVQMNVDVASISFIDGSVLNSRPFREAIGAIRGRPAYRPVDRRLVYVDPNPATAGAAHRGLLVTPRRRPSKSPNRHRELNWIAKDNEQTRRLRDIVDGARPRVKQFVANIVAEDRREPFTYAEIRGWREQADAKAAHDAGFAYEAYVRLKLASARDFVSKLILEVRGVRPHSSFARATAAIIDAWASQALAVYEPTDGLSLHAERAIDSESIRLGLFLLVRC